MANAHFKYHGAEFMKDMEQANKEGLTKAAGAYAIMVKQKLDTPPPRTGRIYYNLKGKRVHRASAKGEPPAPLTRNLLNSIDYYYDDNDQAAYTFTDVKYALSLEMGDVMRKNPLGKRPFFYPTIMDDTNANMLGDIYFHFFEGELG